MKIIGKDNFDREMISDYLVAEKVMESLGAIMVEALNAKLCSDNAPTFYKLVPDDYELWRFEP